MISKSGLLWHDAGGMPEPRVQLGGPAHDCRRSSHCWATQNGSAYQWRPVCFSLSHKRYEDLTDLYIWDTRPKATLDLVILRRSSGFMQQTGLCIAAARVNVRICRRQGRCPGAGGGPGCDARRLGRGRARRRDRDRIDSRHRWRQPVRRHVAGQVCLQLRTARRAPQPGQESASWVAVPPLGALDWLAIILRQ
jgi:hypothetical protein